MEVNKDATMVGIESLIEGLVPAEDDGGEERATAKDIVNNTGAGAAGADIRWPMFVADRIDKVDGAEARTERMGGGDIIIEITSEDDTMAVFVNVEEKEGKIFVELHSGVGFANAAGAKNGPLLSGDFHLASRGELERAGFVDGDVVDE